MNRRSAATVTLLVALMAGLLTACRVPGDPSGSLDAVSAAQGSITVSGWAYDENVPTTSIDVHVFVDGAIAAVTTASGDRPDVAASVPGAGAAHGYHLTLGAGTGTHKVCAYAINQGAGKTNTELGCGTVTVTDGSPIGGIDAAVMNTASLDITGWALDPDTSDPVHVGLEIDGKVEMLHYANWSRPDIDLAYGKGAAHGFDISFVMPTLANSTICINAYNVGGGADRQLGCVKRNAGLTLDADTLGPIWSSGQVNAVPQGGGVVRVSANVVDEFDPDDESAVFVLTFQSFYDGRSLSAAHLFPPRQFINVGDFTPGWTGLTRVCAVILEVSTDRTAACHSVNIT